ncbi:hypothetical protein EJF18_10191 [Clavispora lusitaniae]|uniref:Uncharacterized protein n=1 Tax=Clavispora lusitaniae TaxID=36911 RepID=A0ACD0WCL0_CLALS|nr:hypothetical protein EJF14_10191 [Clavispora lusitaniae]QFZ31591.1 hypothetical protein EJF16_10191 [Clavispora lusitaniae]QFZ37259.1 hypothetical protein EJF15_10191 [Clavispora lusitaniae]QFZ42943.1 hypothetical protein EJF18_10191 [Clavispora lusitaniae]QFZ48619.1 hypothetical protein EJF17_10191 [Clavispora lusitaniae]
MEVLGIGMVISWKGTMMNSQLLPLRGFLYHAVRSPEPGITRNRLTGGPTPERWHHFAEKFTIGLLRSIYLWQQESWNLVRFAVLCHAWDVGKTHWFCATVSAGSFHPLSDFSDSVSAALICCKSQRWFVDRNR